VTDSSTDSSTDVYYNPDFSAQNGRVYFNSTLPRFGMGGVTVTTPGGTSDPLNLNVTRLAVAGTNLGDVAVAANGDIWTSDQANPANLLRIDATTGQVLQTITLNNSFGTAYLFNLAGLQFVPAMSLGGTSVPAGSLLVFDGEPNPDRVTAIDPSNGTILASVQLGANYDLTAGIYDPATQHLFVLEQNGAGSRMIELNPTTGAQINAVTLPFNIQSWAGLAIDPTDGNFWIGSSSSGGIVVKVNSSGTELKRVDLSTQGINNNEISGLAFAPDGSLLVASTHGVIYRTSVA
jgi:WD40 repeat protein